MNLNRFFNMFLAFFILFMIVPMDSISTKPHFVPMYYAPTAVFKTFNVNPSISKRQFIQMSIESQRKIAFDYAKLEMENSTLALTNEVQSNDGTGHFHFTIVIDEIPISNAAININVDRNGKITSLGSTWLSTEEPEKIQKRQFRPKKKNRKFLRPKKVNNTEISPSMALNNFLNTVLGLKFPKNSFPSTPDASPSLLKTIPPLKPTKFVFSGTRLFTKKKVFGHIKYYQTPTELEKVYDLQIPYKVSHFNAFVSIATGKLVGVVDWAIYENFEFNTVPTRGSTRIQKRQSSDFNKRADFKYNVVKFPNTDVGKGRDIVLNPADLIASASGWHLSTSTEGNNAIAGKEDSTTESLIPSKSDSYNFDFPLDLNTESPNDYLPASITNLFYVTNTIHDIAYHYGFTEKAGNFQQRNFGKGGLENDRVIESVQNTDQKNNAVFTSFPDGQNGKLHLYFFDQSNPPRDSAFDNIIVAHEMMHGITSRLTGGASNPNCLAGTSKEANGMSEGYSDTFAIIITADYTHTRSVSRVVGEWSVNNPKGGRKFPYSTDININPLTYASLNLPDFLRIPQRAGNVWANVLFEVYWNFVDAYGFSQDLIGDKAKGNSIFLQLLFDGLQNLPCNPGFLDARDALLAAEKTRRSGVDGCLIWNGFAKRGMGSGTKVGVKTGSKVVYTDDFSVPKQCIANRS